MINRLGKRPDTPGNIQTPGVCGSGWDQTIQVFVKKSQKAYSDKTPDDIWRGNGKKAELWVAWSSLSVCLSASLSLSECLTVSSQRHLLWEERKERLFWCTFLSPCHLCVLSSTALPSHKDKKTWFKEEKDVKDQRRITCDEDVLLNPGMCPSLSTSCCQWIQSAKTFLSHLAESFH